jgi:hypothetical protein
VELKSVVVPYSCPLPLLCDFCAFPPVLLVCWFGTVLQMFSGIRVPATLNPVTDDGAFGYLDAMGFLVKHHPIDFNMGEAEDVDYSLWGYESESLSTGGHALVATKSIQAGEELFYSFHSHPHGGLLSKQTNLFKDLPLADDYDTADAIVKDLIVQFKATGKPINKVRTKQIGKRINVLQLCSNTAICTLTCTLVAMLWVGIFDFLNPPLYIGDGLRAVKGSVGRFNAKVASLLPTLASDLTKYVKAQSPSTRQFAMQKYSYTGLAGGLVGGAGMCLDDVEWKFPFSTVDDANPRKFVTKRRVTNGTVAFPVPLHILQKKHETCSATEETCPSSELSNGGVDTSNCIPGEGTSLLFCPLLVGSIRTIPFPLSEAYEKPNIEFRWSDRNSYNELIKLYSADKIAQVRLQVNQNGCLTEEIWKRLMFVRLAFRQEYATTLSWDAIALRDIEVGEEVGPCFQARCITRVSFIFSF